MLARSVYLVLWLASGAALAGTVKGTDPDTGTPHWQSHGTVFGLEVIQLQPDFVRAVYAARGLPAPLVEVIAGYCVFGSIARNATDHALTYDVSAWRAVLPDGTRQPLKTKDQWLVEWRKQGVGFSWTLLPTTQVFEAGDWGQGFLTVKLPRGARFDLDFTWRQDGRDFSARLEGLECAHDSKP
jgi:hypothetical protein